MSVIIFELLQEFPSARVLHTATRNFSTPFSASQFDSLTSSSSRYFLRLLHHPINFGLRQLSLSSVTVIWLDLSWSDTFKFVSQVLPPRLARGQHRSHTLRALRVEIFALLRLLFALLSLSWVLGSPWVPIPGCFSFFASIWHVFHQTVVPLLC